MAIALYLIFNTCICYNEEHFYDDSVLADWDDRNERAYTKKISLFPGL